MRPTSISLRSVLCACALFGTVFLPVKGAPVFTSSAEFIPGNGGLNLTGQGSWTVEISPAGSGNPVGGPTDLSDGFAVLGGTVFTYVAAAGDIGTSVGGSWAVWRPFTSTGALAKNYLSFTVDVELVQPQGFGAGFLFEARTLEQYLNAGIGAEASVHPLLTELDASASFTKEVTIGSFSTNPSGTDYLLQVVDFTISPQAVGQEVRFILRGGVVSRLLVADASGAVPEPTSLALVGAGFIGLAAARRRRRSALGV